MTTVHTPSFATLLMQGALGAEAREELGRQSRRAALPVALVLALGGVWSATAPLSGAIVAPAQVKVELNRKTVQHQEGGIVREILVRDGQKVRAGEPLVVIGDVRRDAELRLLQDQSRGERIRTARASAETALEANFDPPADLAEQPEAAGTLARERALFAARRRTLDEQVAALRTQIREAHAQVTAFQTQITATETSARLSADELAINDKLAQQGFVTRARLLGLERTAADYRARVGAYRAELAIARSRIVELEARIAQARNQYRQQAADELKDASAEVRELEERLRPSRDQVERQLVRAPVDGEVMALRVSAAGTAIGPRERRGAHPARRHRLRAQGRDGRGAPERIRHAHGAPFAGPDRVRLTRPDDHAGKR